MHCKILQVTGVGGEVHGVLGSITLPVCFENTEFLHEFKIIPKLHHHFIIGNDFLKANKAIIDLGRKTVTFKDKQYYYKMLFCVNKTRVDTEVVVQPTSEMIIVPH